MEKVLQLELISESESDKLEDLQAATLSHACSESNQSPATPSDVFLELGESET